VECRSFTWLPLSAGVEGRHVHQGGGPTNQMRVESTDTTLPASRACRAGARARNEWWQTAAAASVAAEVSGDTPRIHQVLGLYY